MHYLIDYWKKSGKLINGFVLLILYSISRIIFFSMGVRFDTSLTLDFAGQYLDVNLLKDNLFESLYYMHGQPPAFNMFIGAVLKLFPEYYPLVLNFVYLLCGFIISLLIFLILRHFEFGAISSLLFSTVFIITPEAILYENLFFYTWPIATLVLLAAYAILKYENSSKIRYAIVFLASLVLLCLIRSLFHLGYLIICIVILSFVQTPSKKIIKGLSFCAILFVSIVFIKNYLLFGFFGSSSWLGSSLWKIAEPVVSKEELTSLVKKGKISDVALNHSFSSISEYPERYHTVPDEFKKIEVLGTERKKSGDLNLNHFSYINISRDYREASIYVIINNITSYMKQVAHSWAIFSKPSWDYTLVQSNKTKIDAYINVTSFLKMRKNVEKLIIGEKKERKFALSSLVLVPAALLIVFVYFLKEAWNIYKKEIDHHKAFIFFTVGTIFYVGFLVNSIELGENNRFRVMIDPVLYVCTILAVKSHISVLKNRVKEH